MVTKLLINHLMEKSGVNQPTHINNLVFIRRISFCIYIFICAVKLLWSLVIVTIINKMQELNKERELKVRKNSQF